MTHEIKIYGDIVPFKWYNDGSEYDLSDLNNSLSALEVSEGDELIVGIHTFGGCTTTAFGIYNKLRSFQQRNKINLTTIVEGWCASSGVMILLAGDKRIGNKYAEPFIHNAWTWTVGDRNEHQKQAENLTRVDNQIANLYAERTSIEKEKAIELMNAENYISAEDALAYGFYTEFENVYAVENNAVFNSLRSQNLEQRQNFNSNNMSDKNKKSAWNNLKKQIDDFFGGAKNKIVFTADNNELDFYELGENDTPAVGDKAKYDGKPAGDSNNGEYIMATGETYKFTGEELTEIVPKADTTSELEAENETLKAENETLKTEVENLKKEKSTLNKKLSDATSIINGFKNLELEDDGEGDGQEPRNPKPAPTESRAASAFKNLRNKTKDGSNK